MMSSSTPFCSSSTPFSSSSTPFISSSSSSSAFPVDLLSHQLTQPHHHQQPQEGQPHQPLQAQFHQQLHHQASFLPHQDQEPEQVQFAGGGFGQIGHGNISSSSANMVVSSSTATASISGRRNSVIVQAAARSGDSSSGGINGAFDGLQQQQQIGIGTNPVARGQGGGQSGGKRGAKRRRKGGEEGGGQSQSQGQGRNQANGQIHGQSQSQGQIHGQALGQIDVHELGQAFGQDPGQASGQLVSLGQGDELKVPPHQKQLLLAIGLKRALTPEVLGVNRFISPFSPEAKIPLPHELNELSAHGTTVWKRNERERHRVREVNNGYAQLRGQLPLTEQDRRLSKVDTLRMAIVYIRHLELLLDHGLGHQRECQCFSAANFPNSEPGSSAENTPSPPLAS